MLISICAAISQGAIFVDNVTMENTKPSRALFLLKPGEKQKLMVSVNRDMSFDSHFKHAGILNKNDTITWPYN